MSHLWYAHTTSYAGISIGAIHYYVSLRGPDQHYRIEQLMDERMAASLTRKDRGTSYSHQWRVGEPTSRFDTEHQALQAAIVVFKAKASEGDALVHGKVYTMEPMLGLAGPQAFLDVSRVIVKDCQASNWWEGSEANMRALCDRWKLVLEHYSLERSESSHSQDDAYVRRNDSGGWDFVPTGVFEAEEDARWDVEVGLVTPPSARALNPEF